MRTINITLMLLCSLLLSVSCASAFLLTDLGVDVTNVSTGVLLASGSLNISIWDAPLGGNLLYYKYTADAIVNGSWNEVIDPYIEYGQFYYKDYAINGEDIDYSGAERLQFQSNAGHMANASYINFTLIDSCAAGQAIREIADDGSVTCETLIPYSQANCSVGYVAQNVSINSTGVYVFCTPISGILTKYYPMEKAVTGGAVADDNLTLMYWYDGDSYDITEGGGADPLDLYLNFTGVTSFSSWITREYYLGSTAHHIKFQIWDYDASDWEDYYDVVGQEGYNIIAIPVYDYEKHLGTGADAGIVQVRYHHVQNGIGTHHFYVDFSWLFDDFETGIVDLSGYAKYNFTANSFLGTSGNFSTDTGNVTAKWGFFTWVGTLLNKVTAIFADYINITNNLDVGGNVNVTGDIIGNRLNATYGIGDTSYDGRGYIIASDGETGFFSIDEQRYIGFDVSGNVYGENAIICYNGSGTTHNCRFLNSLLINGNVTVDENVTADYYRGSGKYLTDIVTAELDPHWTANQTLVGYVAEGLDQFAATTSAELAGVISDETGSGKLMFATGPSIIDYILTSTNNTATIGSKTNYWSGGFFNHISTSSNVTTSEVIPTTNLTGSVGTPAYRWLNGYLNNTYTDKILPISGSAQYIEFRSELLGGELYIDLYPSASTGHNYVRTSSTGSGAESPIITSSGDDEGKIGTSGHYWFASYINQMYGINITSRRDKDQYIDLYTTADRFDFHPGVDSGDNYVIVSSTDGTSNSPQIISSSAHEGYVGTVDNPFYAVCADVASVDHIQENTAAHTVTIDDAVTLSSTLSAGGTVTMNNYNLAMGNGAAYGSAVNVNDDSVISWTPTNPIGMVFIYTRTSTYQTCYGIFVYRTVATEFLTTVSAGSATANGGGAVLSGTTGTNGYCTISADSGTGKIYFENRLGATVAMGYYMMGL